MPRELDQDELINLGTLVATELALVTGKRGATRLGFALLLRFYTERGRFLRGWGEIPDDAVDYVARQVEVPASELADYDWSGHTIQAHRVQIRRALGFRECSVADADKLTEWLVTNVTQAERGAERVREELLARCRAERIEPPTSRRIDRIVHASLHRGEELLVARRPLRRTVGDDRGVDRLPLGRTRRPPTRPPAPRPRCAPPRAAT